MAEWVPHNLGELIEVQNGYAFKSKDFDDIKGIPVIKIRNVASGELQMDNIKYYPFTIVGLDRFIISKNDILIALTGSHVNQPSSIVGKVARYTNDNIALLNQRVGKIYSLDKKETNEDYIYWFFKQWEITLELALNAGGSANQANISGKLIKTLELELPPLPEQKAIADVLSSLDDKIDLCHRQNKTLEAMAETLFRQWFVEEAQENWEVKPLSEVTKIAIGRTPPRKEFHWFSANSSDVKWVSIKDMGQSGTYVFDTSEYLTQEAVETFNIPIIPIDTVLLSFKMTVGRTGITTEPMLSNEAIAHFKFDKSTPFSKEYLYIYLKIFQYDSLGSTSSIVTAINSSMIKEIGIVIPDDVTMNNFKAKTEPLFNKIRQNQAQIRTLEKLRDTLLPRLMSGEVRVEV